MYKVYNIIQIYNIHASSGMVHIWVGSNYNNEYIGSNYNNETFIYIKYIPHVYTC